MAKKKKTRLCALDVALLIILVLVIAFVSVVLWLFYKYQQEPATLIQYFLGSVAIELLATAWIETAKQKRKRRSKDETNQQDL
ncbi:MAG: hypothetical protein IKF99_08615 [Oscillospiraceae bacterium]|nr:hypothetical protein [Oscillospiraceae bacterium]